MPRWIQSLGNRPARLVIAVVAAAVVTALALPNVRWRIQVLALHFTGAIPAIETREVVAFMMPGSDQSMKRVLETRNPYAVLMNARTGSDDIQEGGRLFSTRCQNCHGTGARGGTRAPALVGRRLNVGESDWAIYRTIQLGRPEQGMPSHPEFSIDQIWKIVAFLRAIDGSTSEDTRHGRSALVNVSYEEIRKTRTPHADWPTYSGDYSGARHSALTQISADNVGRLAIRWIRPIDSETNMTPVVRNGVMFITLPGGRVMALDGASGERLWTRQLQGGMTRGVALLNDRVYVGSSNIHIAALSSADGRTVWEKQIVDDPTTYLITSAPLAYRDLIVSGVATTTKGGRGFVTALDAASGRERWRFETVPTPGKAQHETWAGDSWRNGGAPTWLTGTYDPDLDLLYWGVGNPKPDYDATGREGDNLYSNSVIALNGKTGRLVWHFQFTPGDTHDWDANQVPIIADRKGPNGTEKLLLLANRNGFYYVLDRVTGKFLHAEPFVHQTWTQGIGADGRPLPAPRKIGRPEGDLVYPGMVGGTNWWPPSYDAALDLVFVPVLEQGMIFFSNSTAWPPTASNRPFYTSIRALDARTGKLKWERRSDPRTERNRSEGLVSTDGGLVFGSDMTHFFALDSRTGERLWSMDTGDFIAGAPMTYEHDGVQYVSVAAGHNLLSFALVPERVVMPDQLTGGGLDEVAAPQHHRRPGMAVARGVG